MFNNSIRKRLVLIVFAALLILASGCSTSQDSSDKNNAGKDSGKSTGKKEAPQKKPPPAPEPAKAPPLGEKPAGKVVEVGPEPEGIVADPKTGLVVVSLHGNGKMKLLDGQSGKVVREAEVKREARHLALSAPGGPVLVPMERSNTLAQVELPDGKVVEKTPVGKFPHDAAAYEDSIFVVNEFDSTASVIKNGRVTHTFETPFQPGNVAVTGSGLVGIVGVRGLTLEVWDAETLESQGSVEAGEGPTHLVAGPGDRFYVTDTRGDAVLIYETRPEPKRIGRVSIPGGAPHGIAIDSKRQQLWVTLTAKNRVERYDLSGGSPKKIASYPTVRQPNGVTVDPKSGRVYIGGAADGKVQILNPE